MALILIIKVTQKFYYHLSFQRSKSSRLKCCNFFSRCFTSELCTFFVREMSLGQNIIEVLGKKSDVGMYFMTSYKTPEFWVGVNCSKFDCSTINWSTLLAGNQLLDTKFINCSNPVNPGSTGFEQFSLFLSFARMVSNKWKIVSTSFFEQTNFEQLIMTQSFPIIFRPQMLGVTPCHRKKCFRNFSTKIIKKLYLTAI